MRDHRIGQGAEVAGEVDARGLIGSIEQFVNQTHRADARKRFIEWPPHLRRQTCGLELQQAGDHLKVVFDAMVDFSVEDFLVSDRFGQPLIGPSQAVGMIVYALLQSVAHALERLDGLLRLPGPRQRQPAPAQNRQHRGYSDKRIGQKAVAGPSIRDRLHWHIDSRI